mmetsp:Transcript_9695/g.14219  ORF Transcript_9695/g.14219 Transcript_9695/m.14219 type:complete len:91 (+) Transcript_9695:675-947(+)
MADGSAGTDERDGTVPQRGPSVAEVVYDFRKRVSDRRRGSGTPGALRVGTARGRPDGGRAPAGSRQFWCAPLHSRYAVGRSVPNGTAGGL